MKFFIIFLILTLTVISSVLPEGFVYAWLYKKSVAYPAGEIERICKIETPNGFTRVEVANDSFGIWLRGLPLLDKNEKLYLHNGKLKSNQNAHYQIIDIGVGTKDLQQCADAVIRLRSEFLYSFQKFDSIAFNYTSGDRAYYKKWFEGFRPKITGNDVSWLKTKEKDTTYYNFLLYLDNVFTYAGSYSLSKEMISVNDANNINIGDVFIQGGFPGHAILVVDLSYNELNGEKAVLLAQSYMPAQQVHILENFKNKSVSPWFIIKDTDKLYTPEWTFDWSDLKRFK
ncbi:DUF4846 domain-containing protein [Candidatus Zixiibacteriota bacterium]